ncbi:MAG TPA: copper resistance protein CopB, partial [Stenotrophomonas sp.]|nr:copper resistance protein CopB [Stenotrophomonas sp.]
LLALGLAAALPVFAQSHAGHDMAAMVPPAKNAQTPVDQVDQLDQVDQVDHSKMDHSKMDMGAADQAGMDHSKMDHGAMQPAAMDHSMMNHAAMGHGTPAQTEPREPIPIPTDADRAAAF